MPAADEMPHHPGAMTATLLLYLIGVILLALATAGVSLPRVHFGWAGLTLIAVGALILPAI